jgi:hypothetical protein
MSSPPPPRTRQISTSVERAAIKAIQIEAYGNPTEVVEVVDLPDVGAPAAGEVAIEVEATLEQVSARPRAGRLRY